MNINAVPPLSAEESLALIDKEVERLDALSRQLNQDRTILLRQRNALGPAISKLPVEVLCHIFHHLIFPLDLDARSLRPWPVDHPFHFSRVGHPILLVTSVSHHWRLVARTTPWLWDMMVLDIRPGNVEKASKLLQLHLDLSSDRYFFLELNLLWGSGISHYFGDLSPIERLLFNPSNARRFKTLYVSMPPDNWEAALNNAAAYFTALQNFRFAWDRDSLNEFQNDKHLCLDHLPSLRQCIFKYVTSKIQLPSTHLTKLVLYGLPVASCVELLLQCPSLIEYRSREAQRSHTKTPFPLPANYLTFHHMKTFIFSFCEDPWCIELLEQLRMPVLETLGFEGLICNSYTPLAPIVLFCSRLPQSVTTLHLRRSSYDTVSISQMFDLLPKIRRLVIFDEESTNSIVNPLLALNPARQETKDIKRFPDLDHLEIDLVHRGFKLKFKQVEQIPFLLMNLVVGRKDGLKRSFRADVRNINTEYWDLEVERTFREMVVRGHQLDIRLSGKPVNFLRSA